MPAPAVVMAPSASMRGSNLPSNCAALAAGEATMMASAGVVVFGVSTSHAYVPAGVLRSALTAIPSRITTPRWLNWRASSTGRDPTPFRIVASSRPGVASPATGPGLTGPGRIAHGASTRACRIGNAGNTDFAESSSIRPAECLRSLARLPESSPRRRVRSHNLANGRVVMHVQATQEHLISARRARRAQRERPFMRAVTKALVGTPSTSPSGISRSDPASQKTRRWHRWLRVVSRARVHHLVTARGDARGIRPHPGRWCAPRTSSSRSTHQLSWHRR